MLRKAKIVSSVYEKRIRNTMIIVLTEGNMTQQTVYGKLIKIDSA